MITNTSVKSSSTSLQTMNANTRVVNEIARAQTPTVISNRPLPPKHFLNNPDALDCWDRIINGLQRIRVLLESDSAIAEIYVSAYMRKRRAEQLLLDPNTGEQVLTYAHRMKRSVRFMINPLLDVINKSESVMIKALRELGLTPNSRIKVNISSDSDADKVAEFLEAG